MLAVCRSSIFLICNSFFSDLQGTNQFASEFMKLLFGKVKRVTQLMSNYVRGKNWLFQYATRIKQANPGEKENLVGVKFSVLLNPRGVYTKGESLETIDSSWFTPGRKLIGKDISSQSHLHLGISTNISRKQKLRAAFLSHYHLTKEPRGLDFEVAVGHSFGLG